MFSDHTNRVKRIATAPMWPNTFWSAAEDGIIRSNPRQHKWIQSSKERSKYAPGSLLTFFFAHYRQYDLRESSKRSEVLIDLTEFCGQLVEAKCLAVNPRDNNYLAVGTNGPFVRLYDIRMIHNFRSVKHLMLISGNNYSTTTQTWYTTHFWVSTSSFFRTQEVHDSGHIGSCAHVL